MPIPSDPATELYQLCLQLSKYRSGAKGAEALATFLDVPKNSAEYFVALGVVANRFAHLRDLFEAELPEPQREIGLRTLEKLQSVMTATSQGREWIKSQQTVLTQGNLEALLMSASYIRLIAPISVPTEAERNTVLLDIDEAIIALSEYHGTLSVTLRQSLANVKRFLEKFHIYGADAITDELLKAFALRDIDERDETASPDEKKSRKRAWTACAALVGLLIASDAPLTAVENHYARTQHILQMIEAPEPLKLLPAPEKLDEPKAAPKPQKRVARPPKT